MSNIGLYIPLFFSYQPNFSAGPTCLASSLFSNRSRPKKTGQLFPQLVVSLLVGIEARQPVAFALGGERQLGFVFQADAGGLRRVQVNRIQILQRAIQKCRFPPAPARQAAPPPSPPSHPDRRRSPHARIRRTAVHGTAPPAKAAPLAAALPGS